MAPTGLAQVAGAIAAALLLRASLGDVANVGATLPSGSDRQSFLWEVVLTFFLMLVIMAVATDTRAVGEAAALAIGGTVALCALVGGPVSGASMNPARSLGPALVSGEARCALDLPARAACRRLARRARPTGSCVESRDAQQHPDAEALTGGGFSAVSLGRRALTIAPWIPSATSCVNSTETSSKPAGRKRGLVLALRERAGDAADMRAAVGTLLR